MRFLWILLGIVFMIAFIFCVILLLGGAVLGPLMPPGESPPLIVVGIIAVLLLAVSIYFMQKK